MLHRRGRSGPHAELPEPPSGVHRIDTGTVELVRDRDRPHGWTLLVNGMESSHVDLADPEWLEFEYLRWASVFIERRYPEESAPEVLHLGAGGCSLARHLLVTRPASRHLAVDIDARLADLVREWFALPRAPQLRIRIGDARAVTESLPDNSRDVVVRDAFLGDETPDPMLTVEFSAQVRRVLRPGGLYLANCADAPGLALTRGDIAAIGAVFPHIVLTADAPMLKGRRRGNVVLAASEEPFDDPGLAAALLGGPAPAQLWDETRTREFGRHAAPEHDPQEAEQA